MQTWSRIAIDLPDQIMHKGIALFAGLTFSLWAFAQSNFFISGKVTDSVMARPLPNATVRVKGTNAAAVTKPDGTFKLKISDESDTLEVTHVGFDPFISLIRGHAADFRIPMKAKSGELAEVKVGASQKPALPFMKKVIAHKAENNPAKFRNYHYEQYKKHEVDISNVDFKKTSGNGLRSLLLKTYSHFDESALDDQDLPVYFSESVSNNFVAGGAEHENSIAKKTLGLKTDAFLSKLDKFYFQFNIYEDWLPVFDQTYVSPLNSDAFAYYKFTEGDTVREQGHLVRQIRFVPRRAFEKTFSGVLWVNDSTLAVESVLMNMSGTSDLDFIRNVSFNAEYTPVVEESTGRTVLMPSRLGSDIEFESGLELLGIPESKQKKKVTLMVKNISLMGKWVLGSTTPDTVELSVSKQKVLLDADQPDSFWQRHRQESLNNHEKSIYAMVDSLKGNRQFKRNVRWLGFAGSGYWDMGKYLRLGTISSIVSTNSIEGIRTHVGWWTMQGISKKVNFFGYGAYGTKDRRLKGSLGIKYLWNEPHWTKTTLAYASDYDLLTEQDDEMDKDNFAGSFLRKKIPYFHLYTKQVVVRHEQYLTEDWTARASLVYKEETPTFSFSYHPIDPALDKPYDSLVAKTLPVAEVSVGLRYAHKERTVNLNYDKLRVETYYPVISFNYTYGFEHARAQFVYHRLSASIEQRLRLPPKSMLYYKLEAGKIFGTLPYLMLNVPEGNEYYLSSKYVFNTMTPYEFAADRYLSLHTRFYLGGLLLDRIPGLRTLGWRERFSFNGYWGDMTAANRLYNEKAGVRVTGRVPFMEVSAGIENILHVLSVEYYWRLTHVNNSYATKGGIYAGVTLSF